MPKAESVPTSSPDLLFDRIPTQLVEKCLALASTTDDLEGEKAKEHATRFLSHCRFVSKRWSNQITQGGYLTQHWYSRYTWSIERRQMEIVGSFDGVDGQSTLERIQMIDKVGRKSATSVVIKGVSRGCEQSRVTNFQPETGDFENVRSMYVWPTDHASTEGLFRGIVSSTLKRCKVSSLKEMVIDLTGLDYNLERTRLDDCVMFPFLKECSSLKSAIYPNHTCFGLHRRRLTFVAGRETISVVCDPAAFWKTDVDVWLKHSSENLPKAPHRLIMALRDEDKAAQKQKVASYALGTRPDEESAEQRDELLRQRGISFMDAQQDWFDLPNSGAIHGLFPLDSYEGADESPFRFQPILPGFVTDEPKVE